MKSVARTVCGIELSEDIINLIFAIFDDDDSKDRFHILGLRQVRGDNTCLTG